MGLKVSGAKIRELRGVRGWTAKELASLIRRQEGYVYEIERGEKRPSMETLDRIADVFGVDGALLIDGANVYLPDPQIDTLVEMTVQNLPDHVQPKFVVGEREFNVSRRLLEPILKMILHDK